MKRARGKNESCQTQLSVPPYYTKKLHENRAKMEIMYSPKSLCGKGGKIHINDSKGATNFSHQSGEKFKVPAGLCEKRANNIIKFRQNQSLKAINAGKDHYQRNMYGKICNGVLISDSAPLGENLQLGESSNFLETDFGRIASDASNCFKYLRRKGTDFLSIFDLKTMDNLIDDITNFRHFAEPVSYEENLIGRNTTNSGFYSVEAKISETFSSINMTKPNLEGSRVSFTSTVPKVQNIRMDNPNHILGLASTSNFKFVSDFNGAPFYVSEEFESVHSAQDRNSCSMAKGVCVAEDCAKLNDNQQLDSEGNLESLSFSKEKTITVSFKPESMCNAIHQPTGAQLITFDPAQHMEPEHAFKDESTSEENRSAFYLTTELARDNSSKHSIIHHLKISRGSSISKFTEISDKKEQDGFNSKSYSVDMKSQSTCSTDEIGTFALDQHSDFLEICKQLNKAKYHDSISDSFCDTEYFSEVSSIQNTDIPGQCAQFSNTINASNNSNFVELNSSECEKFETTSLSDVSGIDDHGEYLIYNKENVTSINEYISVDTGEQRLVIKGAEENLPDTSVPGENMILAKRGTILMKESDKKDRSVFKASDEIVIKKSNQNLKTSKDGAMLKAEYTRERNVTEKSATLCTQNDIKKINLQKITPRLEVTKLSRIVKEVNGKTEFNSKSSDKAKENKKLKEAMKNIYFEIMPCTGNMPKYELTVELSPTICTREIEKNDVVESSSSYYNDFVVLQEPRDTKLNDKHIPSKNTISSTLMSNEQSTKVVEGITSGKTLKKNSKSLENRKSLTCLQLQNKLAIRRFTKNIDIRNRSKSLNLLLRKNVSNPSIKSTKSSVELEKFDFKFSNFNEIFIAKGGETFETPSSSDIDIALKWNPKAHKISIGQNDIGARNEFTASKTYNLRTTINSSAKIFRHNSSSKLNAETQFLLRNIHSSEPHTICRTSYLEMQTRKSGDSSTSSNNQETLPIAPSQYTVPQEEKGHSDSQTMTIHQVHNKHQDKTSNTNLNLSTDEIPYSEEAVTARKSEQIDSTPAHCIINDAEVNLTNIIDSSDNEISLVPSIEEISRRISDELCNIRSHIFPNAIIIKSQDCDSTLGRRMKNVVLKGTFSIDSVNNVTSDALLRASFERLKSMCKEMVHKYSCREIKDIREMFNKTQNCSTSVVSVFDTRSSIPHSIQESSYLLERVRKDESIDNSYNKSGTVTLLSPTDNGIYSDLFNKNVDTEDKILPVLERESKGELMDNMLHSSATVTLLSPTVIRNCYNLGERKIDAEDKTFLLLERERKDETVDNSLDASPTVTLFQPTKNEICSKTTHRKLGVEDKTHSFMMTLQNNTECLKYKNKYAPIHEKAATFNYGHANKTKCTVNCKPVFAYQNDFESYKRVENLVQKLCQKLQINNPNIHHNPGNVSYFEKVGRKVYLTPIQKLKSDLKLVTGRGCKEQKVQRKKDEIKSKLKQETKRETTDKCVKSRDKTDKNKKKTPDKSITKHP